MFAILRLPRDQLTSDSQCSTTLVIIKTRRFEIPLLGARMLV